METKMNEYLSIVEKYLKVLTVSERVDIINEIKSHIQEQNQNENKSIDEILEDLGNPKQLANAYIGENLGQGEFNFKNLTKMIFFYSAAGIASMCIVPTLAIMSVAFYGASFIIVLAGLIKTIGIFLGFELPYLMFDFGFWEVPGQFTFFVAIPFAILFYVGSKKLWKVLKSYLSKLSQNHQIISQK